VSRIPNPGARSEADTAGRVELTILMPCFNEAETLATCILKARHFLDESGVVGEILVADNGSTDGSPDIARSQGARVIEVPERGYGAALLGGIDAARGIYVVMGDSDDSYDFSRLQPFLGALRDGADLVMGNRFVGGIAPGAMPALHRYLGNPVLSWLGRLFFSIPIGDFHSGLRGFRTDRIRALGLSTTGMEFASEMVVRSALAGYRLAEVPTTLSKDGRSGPPHLRTWRDGWRHLRFLLIYSPRWLFLYPGLVLFAAGLTGIVMLFPGELRIGESALGIHTFVAACMAVLIGTQGITFAIVARRYATKRGLLPPSARYSALLRSLTPERLLVIGVVLFVVALIGLLWSVWQWVAVGFGELVDERILRVLALSLTGLAASVQLWLVGFLASVMEIPLRGDTQPDSDTGSACC
jgi:glycosyltransferase involved in cell wall biosynthesis